MKLVIDIDEDVYNEIKSIVRKPESLYPLDASIRNGVPVVFGREEPEEEAAYWEVPDPDYDRDGARLPNLVAICSNCQKPARLPRTRYCPNCGRRMVLGED